MAVKKSPFSRAKLSGFPRDLDAKWSSTILSEGFVPFPKKLLRTMREFFQGPSSIEDLAVLLAVVDFKRAELIRNPSLDYLAFLSGLTAAEVSASLERMKAEGLIEYEFDENDGIDVNHYKLLSKIELESYLNE